MEYKWETVPHRAWKDTRAWLLGSFVGWILMIVMPAGCGVLVALFTPINASLVSQAVYGAIGAIIALLAVISITYLIHLTLTPYKQRNEARDELQELQFKQGEREKQDELHFEFDGDSMITTDGKIYLHIVFYPVSPVIVDNLQLELHNERFQSLEWKPFKLDNNHGDNWVFNLLPLRDKEPSRRYNVKLIATIDTKEYESKSFVIDDTQVLQSAWKPRILYKSGDFPPASQTESPLLKRLFQDLSNELEIFWASLGTNNYRMPFNSYPRWPYPFSFTKFIAGL